MPANRRNLVGLSRLELEELARTCGQQPYRGRQLYHGLYGRLLRDFNAFTGLDRGFREHLARECEICYPSIQREVASRDESVRYLFGLADGETVEAVYMPWRLERRGSRSVATPSGRELQAPVEEGPVEADDEPRTTLCISSQVGCALDCKFCFTGLLGARRNLAPGEIVGQVLAIARERDLWGAPATPLAAAGTASTTPSDSGHNGHKDSGARSRTRGSRAAPRVNVVFMGQGEPLLNLEAVLKAVGILADPAACGIPPRRITVSTAGIVPRIYDLSRASVRPKLAISLNASNDEQRDALMPINRKYPLSVLLEACRAYPLRPRERLTFEYVLLDGVNDSEADAVRVAHLLKGLAARVNLIPYNGGEALPYRPPPLERVYRFEHVLRDRGIPAFIRISRGQDIMAACGQLSLAGEVRAG
jgi:23S rRNA (adenine2503-C2)-methyltransferase